MCVCIYILDEARDYIHCLKKVRTQLNTQKNQMPRIYTQYNYFILLHLENKQANKNLHSYTAACILPTLTVQ